MDKARRRKAHRQNPDLIPVFNVRGLRPSEILVHAIIVEGSAERSVGEDVQDIVERSGVIQAKLKYLRREFMVEQELQLQNLARLWAHLADRTETGAPSVPAVGERLIAFFCARETAEAILGDLEEQFRRYAERWGEPFARRWYWWQAGVISLRFGWRWALRLVKLGAAARRIMP